MKYGLAEESFAYLAGMFDGFKANDSMTYTKIEKEGDVFVCCIYCPGISRSIAPSIRKFIAIDACFSKNKHKYAIPVAIGLDANNQQVLLAIGVFGSESDDNWDWFYSQLIAGYQCFGSTVQEPAEEVFLKDIYS